MPFVLETLITLSLISQSIRYEINLMPLSANRIWLSLTIWPKHIASERLCVHVDQDIVIRLYVMVEAPCVWLYLLSNIL